MSVNLPQHYVQQYASNIQLLLQQKGSVLRDSVTMGSYIGKQASPVDQIGAVVANKVTGRFQPMGRVDAPLDRRWVFPVDYDLPQLIDQFDKLRLLLDPQSALVQNGVYAMGRAMDDEIIPAFFADAKTGENGGTTTSFGSTVSTSGGQNVAVAFGAASATGLTVAKLREAVRIAMANQVDLDSDPLHCIITSQQHDNLLAEAQIVSRDFNDRLVLVDGRVRNFLGITFHICERLTKATDDASGTSWQVPVYARSGMHLGIWNDITTSVSRRNDLQGEPFQAYCYGTFGATRLEEKKVIRVWCR